MASRDPILHTLIMIDAFAFIGSIADLSAEELDELEDALRHRTRYVVTRSGDQVKTLEVLPSDMTEPFVLVLIDGALDVRLTAAFNDSMKGQT